MPELLRYGTMDLDALDGKSCPTWSVGLDEDLERSIRAQVDAVRAAYESRYGRSRLEMGALAPFDSTVVAKGRWSRVMTARLSSRDGSDVRTLSIYVTSGVVPRKDPRGRKPIIGCPGLQVQLRVT